MAGIYSVSDLMDPEFMSGAYEELTAKIIESNELYDMFGTGVNEEGHTSTITYFAAEKDPAPLNYRGSPAHTLTPTGAKKRDFTGLHAYNEMTLPVDSFSFLERPDSQMVDEKGRMEISRQWRYFGYRHQLARRVSLAKAMQDGVIYLDASGDILEDSTGAVTTVSLGVPAGHQSQLDWDGGGDIIGTAWDNAAANILQDLDEIVEAAEKENAPRPRHVFMHQVAKQWLRDNTEFQGFYQNSPNLAEAVLNGETPTINGFTFHFDASSYTDSGGTTVDFFPKTQAIICPDRGPWFHGVEKPEYIANGIGLVDSVDQALGNLTKVYGTYSYMTVGLNPVKITLYVGDNWFYGFAQPEAIWQPTVDF